MCQNCIHCTQSTEHRYTTSDIRYQTRRTTNSEQITYRISNLKCIVSNTLIKVESKRAIHLMLQSLYSLLLTPHTPKICTLCTIYTKSFLDFSWCSDTHRMHCVLVAFLVPCSDFVCGLASLFQIIQNFHYNILYAVLVLIIVPVPFSGDRDLRILLYIVMRPLCSLQLFKSFSEICL